MFFKKFIKVLRKVFKIYLIKTVVFTVVLYPTELGVGLETAQLLK